MPIDVSNLIASGVSISAGTVIPPASDPSWSSVTLLTKTTGVNSGTNNVFIDSSPNNFIIIQDGTSTTQGAFTPTLVADGHSGFFLNRGLKLSNFTYSNYTASTFTIEAWVYPTVTNTLMSIFSQDNTQLNQPRNNFKIGADNKLYYDYYDNAQATISTSGTISPNTWTHVAISRNGTSVKMFINGVAQYTGTIASMRPSPSIDTYIGGTTVGNYARYTGYMSDVRVTTTAVYTSNFSVPTAPLTAITGTQLLLSFNNANIYDATFKNEIFTIGNSQASTDQARFGTTSIKLDGTGDYLTMNVSNANFNFGTGDFTVEGWYYPTNVTGVHTLFCLGTEAANRYVWALSGTSVTSNLYGSSSTTYTSTVPINTWTYIAVVRSGSTVSLYINGTASATTDTQSGTIGNGGMKIGSDSSGSAVFAGYVQDFRVTKGVARYTANFAAPTQPFPTN